MARKKSSRKSGTRSTFKELTERMGDMLGAHGDQLERSNSRQDREQDYLDCLKESLQRAIDLEFSTIPPYLMALWSIKDELHPAAKSIREVVQEEMLHMALACNMLTGIGGQPQITWNGFPDDEGYSPRYPMTLPGGLHPELEVSLSGLSDESLIAFMQIELPVTVFALSPDDDWNQDRLANIPTSKGKNTTIGEFYEHLLKTFEELNPEFNRDHQITGPLAYSNIGDVRGVKWAIELISHQGEGSTKSPFEDKAQKDLAHFYRFEEVYMEAELKWSALPSPGQFRMGEERRRPDVWPVAAVPKDGYKDDDLKGLDATVRKQVQSNLRRFDEVYSRLLDLLQATWSGGGQRTLVRAYETMFDLEQYAKPLMEVEIPDKPGETFGPCFRYVEQNA